MELWNFFHETLGMHVYDALTIALAVIMVIAGIIHMTRQKKREDDHEDELKKLSGGTAPAEPLAEEKV